ncbi:MAG TPA: hypothetical protein VGM88_05240 [Kofleriaceae bacterium]|jgi:hypothetical protein
MKRKKSSQPAERRERDDRKPVHTVEIELVDIVDEEEVGDAIERDLVCGVY